MASSSPLSTSSTLIEIRAPRQPAAPPQCVSLPALPPPAQGRAAKATTYSRRSPRSVVATATGDGSVLAGDEIPPAPPSDAAESELQILQTIQGAWEKIEDKYAVSSLIVAGFVAIWGSSGVISAIDRLPLVPGVLELVGIGYTGWFAYRNLIFKPEREALFRKIKVVYNDVTGTTKGDEVIVETSISEVVEQEIEAAKASEVVEQEIEAAKASEVVEQEIEAAKASEVVEQEIEAAKTSEVIEQEIEATKASEVVEQESDEAKSSEVAETSRFNWG